MKTDPPEPLEPPAKPPTITDVAREAGVSVATVSYVLSGKRPIGEATRNRVLEIIARLRYRPNPHAQGLKSGRTNLLNVTVSDWRERSISPMIRGIEAAAKAHGVHLIVNSCEEFDNDLAAVFEHVARRRVDGVLFASGIAAAEPFPDFPDIDIPLVGINRPVTAAAPAVLCDQSDGGYQVAEHVLSAGSRCPAVITGPPDRAASRERVEGFRRGLAAHGIELTEDLIYEGDFEAHSGSEGIRALRALRPDVDAIFCTNDTMAAGAVSAALQDGVRLPGEVRIVGFNNRKFTEMFPVPITSLAIPLEEMGRLATETLLELIAGGAPRFTRLLVRSTLHQRESSVPAGDAQQGPRGRDALGSDR